MVVSVGSIGKVQSSASKEIGSNEIIIFIDDYVGEHMEVAGRVPIVKTLKVTRYESLDLIARSEF